MPMSPIAWIIAVVLLLILLRIFWHAGFRFIMQAAVIAAIASYVFLGPYSSYLVPIRDQAKDAGVIGYRAVSGAIGDVWLLGTNPTVWYAKQQVVNAAPESPVDYPKGVEISLLETLPPTVPKGQQFALAAVIQNQGRIDESAKDVQVWFHCDRECNSAAAAPASYDNAKSNPDQNTFYIDSEMQKGEAAKIDISGFTAEKRTGREADPGIANILLNLSYRYSTSSSLLTQVMSKGEIDRKIRANENVFRPVVALAKSTTARLSLNVGPQPLTAGQKALLLVSVSSTRDDGTVLLKKGSKITISLPETIGSEFQCDAQQAVKAGNKYVVSYEIPSDVRILSYDFRSIFAFICEFTANENVDISASDLITADLPDYIFGVRKKIQVPLTPAIGIAYDPNERVCNNAFTTAEALSSGGEYLKNKCHSLSRCYYETVLLGDTESVFSNTCHSCGPSPTCSQFVSAASCSAASRCGLSCSWNGRCTSPTGGLPSGTFTVTATREGLVGGTTASGYIVQPNDYFAALPDRSALGREIEVWVDGKAPIRTTVKDVGPWYIDDPYWLTNSRPLAEQDFNAGRPIQRPPNLGKTTNGAGIDLADGLFFELSGGVDSPMEVHWKFVTAPTASATNYISQSAYNTIVSRAPARSAGVSYIILHHSAGTSVSGVLQENLNSGLSEHYIVDKDGTIVAVIPEDLSAQHANCMNSASIGIEIVNKGDGVDQYPQAQVDSLRTLVSGLISKYNIQPGHLVGHGCTNPGKEADEPTGLDPNFLGGWTVVKRENSPAICSVYFCDPSNPSRYNPSATI